MMETVFVWAAKRVANGPVREGAGGGRYERKGRCRLRGGRRMQRVLDLR
ncbi:MAG: hypothetical protein ACLTQI_00360 [Slackia sp.]